MEVERFLNNLKKADKAFLDEQLLRIVQEESNFAIDLNQTQLLSGKDSLDNDLKEYSSNSYAIFKNRLNPIAGFGRPDLKLTGSFYNEMYLQFTVGKGWPVSFYSRDEKTSKLITEYGKDIFGLTDDNLENFRDHIKPKVQELFAKVFSIQ